MTFGKYLKLTIWEILLVGVAAVSLTYVLLDSFYIAPALQYSPAPGVIAAVMTVALFLAAFNGRTARLGGVAIAIACVVGLLVAISFSIDEFLTDTEDSYFFFAIVCMVGPFVVFALSRARWGTAVLFGAGSFVCAWIQFFYEFNELGWTIAFVIASLMLIIYKNYQLSARRATSVRKLSFTAGFGVSAGAVAVAVGLACVVWFGIISPLGPEALDIKLITEYRALETELVLGTSSEEMMPNMELTSDQLINQYRTTDDLIESEDGTPMPAPEDDPEEGQDETSGSFLGIDLSSVQEAFDFITYDQTSWWWLVPIILIPLLIVAYFVGRRIWRNHRLDKWQQLPPADMVSAMYLFFLKKMKRIGYAVPEGVTLLEFARNNEETLREFQEQSGVGFYELTATYVASTYGRVNVTVADAAPFADFYHGFWRAARKKLGNVKYFFKSFTL